MNRTLPKVRCSFCNTAKDYIKNSNNYDQTSLFLKKKTNKTKFLKYIIVKISIFVDRQFYK